MAFLKLNRHHSIRPYSFTDPNKRVMNADYWLSFSAAAFLAVALLLTGSILYLDSHATPKIAFAKSDWLADHSVTMGCDLESQAKITCPANGENKNLWLSELRRDSPQFNNRYAANTSESFWWGLKVSPEQMKLAAKSAANVLVLPRVNGTAQVWIDGVYQLTHDFSQQRMPLQIPISKSRLLGEHELVVAMNVFPYPHQQVPERAGDVSEGFYTELDADHLTRGQVFMTTSQHLLAVGFFLLVAAFLWSISSSGRTRDFAVGTQLAFVIALITLMSVDLSFRVFNVSNYETLYFSLLTVEAVLISRFTWTILRSTRGTTYAELGLLFACFLIPTALNTLGWIEVSGVNLMTMWVLPLIYLTCAAAIGLRFFRIAKRNSNSSKTRREFLALTLITTTLVGVSYLIESRHQSGFHVVWSRWINILILFGLVRVFTKSHQTKSSLIELSPSSSFHKLDTLPEKVEGWLVSLDVLKFSRDRQVMSTIISHLWTISQLNGGEVIKAEEGALLILFAKSPNGSEDRHLVTALSDMSHCVKDLEDRLPIVFPAKSYSTSILFRASVMRAAIKPGFHKGETGLSKIPMWFEIDPFNSMKGAKDLLHMNLDAALRSNDSSIVIMKTNEAEELEKSVGLSSRAKLSIDEPGVTALIAGRLNPSTSPKSNAG